MIFHENCLLADNSHEISYLIFFSKLGNMSQNLSSAAVMIGALRVNIALGTWRMLKHEKTCLIPTLSYSPEARCYRMRHNIDLG